MTALFHGGIWNNDHDKKIRKQSDPSLMQAICKASPVILEIRIALYHHTERLILSSPTEFIAGSDHELSGLDLSREKGEKLDPAGAEVHYLL